MSFGRKVCEEVEGKTENEFQTHSRVPAMDNLDHSFSPINLLKTHHSSATKTLNYASLPMPQPLSLSSAVDEFNVVALQISGACLVASDFVANELTSFQLIGQEECNWEAVNSRWGSVTFMVI